MRLHRLLGIIMLLDARGVMKSADLAKILETSERTIYRDMNILCEAGIPICSVPGPTGGFSFVENYKVNSNILDRQDIMNILLSSMGIRPERNTEMEQQIKNTIIKLENSVSEEHRKEIINAKEKFFVDSDPWWGRESGNKNVDIIKKSVIDLRKLKITYRKYDGETSERIIRPYGIVIKNLQWYVVAFCETKKDIRTFKCNRIESIEVINENFIMPCGFSLENFWEKNKEQFVNQSLSNEVYNAYPVKIKFFEKMEALLKGFFILSQNEIEGYEICDVDMISFETACNMLFTLSDRLEVIEPVEVREYIILKAQKILNLYKP